MDPGSLQQILQLATRHFRAGQFAQAETLARQVLGQSPEQPDALDLLGVIAARHGRMAAAEQWLARAVTARPGDPQMHEHLGLVLRQLDQPDAAQAAFERVIQLQLGNFEAHAQLGAIFAAKADDARAAAAYRRAVQLKPDFVAAWNNLGLILQRQKNHADAADIFRRCIALQPALPETHNNLGNALQALGQPEAALAEFRQAIALRPQFAMAHNNAGSALRELDRFDEARAAFDRAIALQPALAGAYNNRGYIRDADEIEQALADFRQAIALAPDFAAAHWNYALMLLRHGDFPRGWAQYEWRWRWKGFTSPARSFSRPPWDGSNPAGKTIYLHAEQGIGDTIQFVRFAPLLAERGAKVIVECQPPLERLLRTVPGISRICTSGAPPPEFDLHLPMLSLPRMFGTTLETIPRNTPYVQADAEAVERWRQRLRGNIDPSDTVDPADALGADHGRAAHAKRDCGDGVVRVGLVWAGREDHSADRHRSIALASLAPLWQTPGVQFYSLQKGPAAGQVHSQPAGLALIDHSADLGDFADTAALIANLDLTITVDTAVAHLAGAMGKPAWVLLPRMPDWRWMLGRSDSPWYPSLRLFRQPRRGDWGAVIAEVARELGKSARSP